jgi:hypothetical protein
MSAEISTMITQLKTEYLDNRNVGIRRFAAMTNIKRSRLLQLFSGKVEVTQPEFDRIKIAVDEIECQFKLTESKKPKTDNLQPADYITDPRLLQF